VIAPRSPASDTPGNVHGPVVAGSQREVDWPARKARSIHAIVSCRSIKPVKMSTLCDSCGLAQTALAVAFLGPAGTEPWQFTIDSGRMKRGVANADLTSPTARPAPDRHTRPKSRYRDTASSLTLSILCRHGSPIRRGPGAGRRVDDRPVASPRSWRGSVDHRHTGRRTRPSELASRHAHPGTGPPSRPPGVGRQCPRGQASGERGPEAGGSSCPAGAER
jgi:hypothetical protein